MSSPLRSPEKARAERYWPFDVSHEATLKIGEVRDILANEFPMLSVSKIRHYESIELITIERTPSNQRLFSQADVERLRFILTEQRDRYLPLTQIAELLRQLDSGQAGAAHPGRMRVVDEDDIVRPRPGTRLTKAEVADLTGASIELIEDVAEAGIVEVDPRGRLTSQAVDIVRFAMTLTSMGADMRQIRAIKTSAHAHASMISTHVATQFARHTPASKERGLAQATEMSALAVKLYQALLVENLEIELN